MDLQLKNKHVLITGSSRGLGKLIATAFLSEGAKVCLVARGEENLISTQKEFQKNWGEKSVKAFSVDLSQAEGIRACTRFVEKEWGRLDVLVTNAGSSEGKAGLDLSLEDWQHSLQLNLISPSLLISASYPLLKKTKGSITCVSSIAGREVLPAPIAYSSSKLGLLALTKNYSRFMAKDGVRINEVVPGNILLPEGVWEKKLKENKKKVESYIESEVPLNRFASGEEIANAVLFLSSPKASFITGASLVVDGGQTRGFL